MCKKIIQNGIKEVIYLSDKYKDTDQTIASKMMFDTCGVKYRELKKDQAEIIVSLELDKTIQYIKRNR